MYLFWTLMFPGSCLFLNWGTYLILSWFAGFVAGLASILCIIPFPDPFDEINSIALWAVVTTDLLYESNIGLSVSKGFNRVVGTLAAGLIAMALNQIGPILGYQIYPYFVVRKLFVWVAVWCKQMPRGVGVKFLHCGCICDFCAILPWVYGFLRN